jgi:UDP-N-acetylmuramate dehydrogenase
VKLRKRKGKIVSPGIEAVESALRNEIRGSMEKDIVLAGFTTFKIGGPADLLVIPKGKEDLLLTARAVADSGERFLVLGKGSNVLVSDKGYRGVVILLSEGMRRIWIKGKDMVEVEAGCGLDRLIRFAMGRGLRGVEDLSGIPGTVGGAVRMNAGAKGACMGDRIKEISLLRIGEGWVRDSVLNADEVGFEYRQTGLTDSEIVYKVKLELYKGSRQEMDDRRREVLKWRRDRQPLDLPSAGSVFRNPERASAGELIERCGLKSLQVGDAMVSPVHANFIVNTGAASAEDVYGLILRVKEKVLKEEGVELQEEIKLIGEIRGGA